MKKSVISMLLVFAVLAFLVSCGGSEETDDSTCGIYGYVTDYDSGELITNALCRLSSGERASTGYDGYFEFRNLSCYESYAVGASKAGYPTYWGSVHLENKMVRFDIQLGAESELSDTSAEVPSADKDIAE